MDVNIDNFHEVRKFIRDRHLVERVLRQST